MKEYLDLGRNLLGLMAVLWVLFGLVIGIEIMSNEDMKPSIRPGDILIYSRMDRSPDIRDIVVIKKNDTVYIGRVAATGGDKVEITKDSILMVNDNIVTEENIPSTPLYEGFLDYPLVLNEKECFVLSDRREGGEDSRYYGTVKYEEILGTVIGQYRRGST